MYYVIEHSQCAIILTMFYVLDCTLNDGRLAPPNHN